MTTTTSYDPGEPVMPYRGKGGTGSCWEGPNKLVLGGGWQGRGEQCQPREGVRKNRFGLFGGERKEVEEAERKGFKEEKSCKSKRSSAREGKGPEWRLLQEGSRGQVDKQGLLCSPFAPPRLPALSRQAESKSCCCAALHPGEVQVLESRTRRTELCRASCGQNSWQAGWRDACVASHGGRGSGRVAPVWGGMPQAGSRAQTMSTGSSPCLGTCLGTGSSS